MELKTAFMDYRKLNEDVRRMSRRELRREVVYLTVHRATLADEKHELEQALDRHITLVADLKAALRKLLNARIDGVEDALRGGDAGGAGNGAGSGPDHRKRHIHVSSRAFPTPRVSRDQEALNDGDGGRRLDSRRR